jgi:hypothetical protein
MLLLSHQNGLLMVMLDWLTLKAEEGSVIRLNSDNNIVLIHLPTGKVTIIAKTTDLIHVSKQKFTLKEWRIFIIQPIQSF